MEDKVVFSLNGDELHCHDRRYGAPATTLKRRPEGFVLESCRDFERGGTYHKTYADVNEAVNAFMEFLLADYRY